MRFFHFYTYMHINLRNLPTYTVNTLLLSLTYVISIQYSVVKQNFNIIHIMCENFRAIPLVLCEIQFFQSERVKPKVTHVEFRLKFVFQ